MGDNIYYLPSHEQPEAYREELVIDSLSRVHDFYLVGFSFEGIPDERFVNEYFLDRLAKKSRKGLSFSDLWLRMGSEEKALEALVGTTCFGIYCEGCFDTFDL